MTGGTNYFISGLVISSNSILSGCGTILGAVTNYGTILLPSSCHMIFSGGLVNYGTIIATNNTAPPPTTLADRLVAYWKMDDGLANVFAATIIDSKDTNHATFVRNDGLSHWMGGAAGRFGGSLQLAGTNAFVNVASNANLNISTNELTFSAWVKLEQFPAQLVTSFGSIYDSTSDCYILYLDKVNNELRFKITDTNGQAARPGIAAALLQTNEWLHIAAVYNGNAGSAGHATIYLNGALMDIHTGNDTTPGSGLTANVKTGQVASMGREGPTGGNGFFGTVDDFAIWKRALSQAEIQAIYDGGQAGQSLGDLLLQPTNLLAIASARITFFGGPLEIDFQNSGPWTSFQLRRATNIAGPYFPITGLVPTALGGGSFRFSFSPTNSIGEFYRIEGY